MTEATRPLRIAMLAPISWPVPPEGYGPWEKVVWSLTEELVHQGHKVTLFAAAGSRTSAQLVETIPYPLADHATGFVTVPVDDVLASMHSEEG